MNNDYISREELLSCIEPMFNFKGSALSADLVGLKGNHGDIVYCADTGLTYVNMGYHTWEPLSVVSDLNESSAPERRIIEHCPHCGGPITKIQPRAYTSGHQQCEWCMTEINIYQD